MGWQENERDRARAEVVSVRLSPRQKQALIGLAKHYGYPSTAHLLREVIASPEFGSFVDSLTPNSECVSWDTQKPSQASP